MIAATRVLRPASIAFDGGCLRPWRADDLDALVPLADDAQVSAFLRDRFPHPYTRADGEAFLAAQAAGQEWTFAIELGGALAGGIGVRPGSDVHRYDAELGYWLGRPFQGRGALVPAIRALVPRAMASVPLLRVHAGVYEGNERSMRLLERVGFVREGVLRRAAVKRGRILDLVVYAHVREDFAASCELPA